MRKLITLLIILAVILLLTGRVFAHHRPDHNPPGHQVDVPEQVCNDNPSQNHNPHCQPDEVEPPVDEPTVEEEPEVVELVEEEKEDDFVELTTEEIIEAIIASGRVGGK
jgi:hypothetical protein